MTTDVAIDGWIGAAPNDEQRELRRAVHVILIAIGELRRRGVAIVMKGGILLAVRHKSDRFTRDIDFSTTVTQHELAPEAFVAALADALAIAVDRSPHGLDCRVQGHELMPASMQSTMPTLRVRVGYAPLADRRRGARLQRGESTTVVAVEVSYNEIITAEEVIDLGDGVELLGSTLADAVGEKFRAMLQQPIRKRARRQDAFDVHTLLEVRGAELAAGRAAVLAALVAKCRDRGVSPHRDSLRDPQVEARSRADYPRLADEIPRALPPFDAMYASVRGYYESLPWPVTSGP